MTDTAVLTGNAAKVTFYSEQSPPRPLDVAHLLEALGAVIGMIAIVPVDSVDAQEKPDHSVERIDARVLSVQPGSVEIVIGVIGGAGGLSALVLTLQAIRFWSLDQRIREAMADEAEAKARKTAAEAEQAELAVKEMRRQERSQEEDLQKREDEYASRWRQRLNTRDRQMEALARELELTMNEAGIEGTLTYARASVPGAEAFAHAEDEAIRTIEQRVAKVEIVTLQ